MLEVLKEKVAIEGLSDSSGLNQCIHDQDSSGNLADLGFGQFSMTCTSI